MNNKTFTGFNTTKSNSSDNINYTNSKLIDDSLFSSQNSDLSNLILSIDIINYTCFTLVIFLFSTILLKYLNEYFNKSRVNINLSRFIGNKFNETLHFYLKKTIMLNRKTSDIHIFIILLLLFIGLGISCFFVTELYDNIDTYIYMHINKN